MLDPIVVTFPFRRIIHIASVAYDDHVQAWNTDHHTVPRTRSHEGVPGQVRPHAIKIAIPGQPTCHSTRRFLPVGDWHTGITQCPRDQSGIDQLPRSEEHTSELQSLMRSSYAVFCLKN